MNKRRVQLAAAFVVCAAMMTSSAWAQGRGHGRSTTGANQTWRGDHDGDRDAWRNSDWRGNRGRGTSGDNQRPRGWDKGKKTGWRDCDVPPGQAKKMGCTPMSHVFSDHRHHSGHVRRDGDRDHDRDDRMRRVSSSRTQRDRSRHR